MKTTKIIIGNGHIPRVEVLKLLVNTKKSISSCKRCDIPNIPLKKGYCFDCEEELENEAK